jgi:hypothetical protein
MSKGWACVSLRYPRSELEAEPFFFYSFCFFLKIRPITMRYFFTLVLAALFASIATCRRSTSLGRILAPDYEPNNKRRVQHINHPTGWGLDTTTPSVGMAPYIWTEAAGSDESKQVNRGELRCSNVAVCNTAEYPSIWCIVSFVRAH